MRTRSYKNSEGYKDNTAGKAMSSMSNSTNDKINEKCRRLRMMSNPELYRYIENRANKAKSEGYNQGVRVAVKKNLGSYDESMKKLLKVRGVGEKLAKEILAVLYAE